MRRMVVGALLAGILLLVVAHRAAAQGPGGKGAAGGPPAMPAPEVEVAPAQMKSLPRVSEQVGRIESSNTVEIRARVEGFLEKQRFADGALVKKDQSLFTIESESYIIALSLAKAELAKAKASLLSARRGVAVLEAKGQLMSAQATRILAEKELARIRPLVAANVSSQQDLDAADAAHQAALATEGALDAAFRQAEINQETEIELAEATVQAAEAAVKAAELKRGYTDVRAPIDGRIGRAQHQPGALVGKDMASPTLLATISSIQPMWATWSISEMEYLKLTDGVSTPGLNLNANIETVELILADGRPYPHAGRINFVDRAIDPRTGTLSMRGEFDNPEGLLLEGLFCKVRLTTRADAPSLMIPQRAIQEMQGETFVFVVTPENKAEQRKIAPGERIGAEQVVLGGLAAGERVIVGGNIRVQPGIVVKPIETGDAAAKREN